MKPGFSPETEEMADCFLDYGVKTVIIKLGSKGCLLRNRNQTYRLPGYRIDAVDATGAGIEMDKGWTEFQYDNRIL